VGTTLWDAPEASVRASLWASLWPSFVGRGGFSGWQAMVSTKKSPQANAQVPPRNARQQGQEDIFRILLVEIMLSAEMISASRRWLHCLILLRYVLETGLHTSGVPVSGNAQKKRSGSKRNRTAQDD